MIPDTKEKLLYRLSCSKFRSSFHLNSRMKEYVREKGTDKIREHAIDFILNRIGPAFPQNDGKQTPMRQVHPVFIAQHACACCCRECLSKWYGIEKGRELTAEEIGFIVDVVMTWIGKEIN